MIERCWKMSVRFYHHRCLPHQVSIQAQCLTQGRRIMSPWPAVPVVRCLRVLEMMQHRFELISSPWLSARKRTGSSSQWKPMESPQIIELFKAAIRVSSLEGHSASTFILYITTQASLSAPSSVALQHMQWEHLDGPAFPQKVWPGWLPSPHLEHNWRISRVRCRSSGLLAAGALAQWNLPTRPIRRMLRKYPFVLEMLASFAWRQSFWLNYLLC